MTYEDRKSGNRLEASMLESAGIMLAATLREGQTRSPFKLLKTSVPSVNGSRRLGGTSLFWCRVRR